MKSQSPHRYHSDLLFTHSKSPHFFLATTTVDHSSVSHPIRRQHAQQRQKQSPRASSPWIKELMSRERLRVSRTLRAGAASSRTTALDHIPGRFHVTKASSPASARAGTGHIETNTRVLLLSCSLTTKPWTLAKQQVVSSKGTCQPYHESMHVRIRAALGNRNKQASWSFPGFSKSVRLKLNPICTRRRYFSSTPIPELNRPHLSRYFHRCVCRTTIF